MLIFLYSLEAYNRADEDQPNSLPKGAGGRIKIGVILAHPFCNIWIQNSQ